MDKTRSFQGLRTGFALIELMIVVAILAILAAIAIPKFAGLIEKSREAALKGTMGGLRGALRLYFADTEGTDMSSWDATGSPLIPQYYPAIPIIYFPRNQHPPFRGCWNSGGPLNVLMNIDSGQYVHRLNLYFNGFYLECTHTDSKGTVISNY